MSLGVGRVAAVTTLVAARVQVSLHVNAELTLISSHEGTESTLEGRLACEVRHKMAVVAMVCKVKAIHVETSAGEAALMATVNVRQACPSH